MSQCLFIISDNDDGYSCCCLERGHVGPHKTNSEREPHLASQPRWYLDREREIEEHLQSYRTVAEQEAPWREKLNVMAKEIPAGKLLVQWAAEEIERLRGGGVQHLQYCLYAIRLAVKNDDANKGTPLHRHIERILSAVPKTPAQTSLELLFEAMGVDMKQAEKLAAIDVITKSTACDLRKLQNIAGVIAGTFQTEYFLDPAYSANPVDGLGGAS